MIPRFAALPILLVALAAPLWAQQADVIRGRVTNDRGDGVGGAAIAAVSIPNNVTKTTKADRNGRFTITVPNGDGDYWITVTAIGYTQRKFELKRLADEDILVADAKLEGSGVRLDSVIVRGDRVRVGRNDNADVSGTEKSVGNGAVDPGSAGNLAAMAASLPGVQLIPGADGNPDQFSVFGLGGDQNRATLNGLSFGASDVPRDAAMKSALGTTPWDVSRGGFSGALFSMKTQSGSNFSTRGLSSLVNAPALEWTNRSARSTGAEFTSLSLGAAQSGPVQLDASFYNAGYQFDQRRSDPLSIVSADGVALGTAGIARDSLDRLRSMLTAAGVPQSVGGMPSSRVSSRGLFLGSMDFAPPASTSGQALNITAVGSFNRLNAPLARVTAFPTTDLRSSNLLGSLQARHTNYIGFGVLTETSLGITRSVANTDPYLALPSGVVRVTSDLGDGEQGISQITFGGSPVQNTRSATTTLAAQNQLSWFTLDNTHRLKLTSELRYDRFDQDLTSNALGTFTFNSLADFEAGRAASYTRLLSPRRERGGEVTGALAIGDSYRPTTDLQLQYGVRVDANQFLSTPAINPEIASTFGVRNDRAPNRVSVSPRAGFSWTYGTAPQLALASGFARGPRAVVRGGVGFFQNTPGAQLLAPAMGTTGLAGAVQQVTCVGSAVPVPAWDAYRTDPSAIPAACADGSSSLGGMRPNVVLVDPAYSAPRSLRANLNWSGALPRNRFAATVDATWSLNRDQPGMTDLNFDPTVRFTLADEGGRPVFANAANIVPGTGAVPQQEARRSASFARVFEQRSDLRSASRQLSVGIRPMAFSSRFGWSLTYVYSSVRDIAVGFVSTSGDPRERVWGRSALDTRHQIAYAVSYNLLNLFPLSLTGSFRSGRPFTPLVAGDINGDGFANDRAFVFDPRTTTDASLASGIGTLLDGGSPAARACLGQQLGRVAGRNSCQAPWTTTSSLTIALNPVKFRLPQRLNVSLFVNNAFGAADLLVHGDKNRRGWGQAIAPDQTLLFVRGFDAASQRFKYDVNPRFGATSPNKTVNLNPVVITVQARIDIGYARERQLLTQSLDRGRVTAGPKPSDQELASMSSTLVPPNPMTLLLQQTDSLKLTRKQADSLSTLNRKYGLAFSAIWTPVAKYLAALPAMYDRAAAYARYRKAREASVDALIRIAPAIRGLLTPAQIRALPDRVASSLDVRYLASVRSATSGGADMGVLAMLSQMGWMGGSVDASQGTQTIMVHK